MGYKLVDNHWLDKQVALVRSTFIKHLDPDVEYSDAELLALLADHGLVYTSPQIISIRDTLLDLNVIEEV